MPAPVGAAQPDLGEATAEPGEHLLHVAPLLHGDDPQVVLLVDPHQKGLAVIMPGGGARSSRLPGLWSQGTSQKPLQEVPRPEEPRESQRCPSGSAGGGGQQGEDDALAQTQPWLEAPAL